MYPEPDPGMSDGAIVALTLLAIILNAALLYGIILLALTQHTKWVSNTPERERLKAESIERERALAERARVRAQESRGAWLEADRARRATKTADR